MTNPVERFSHLEWETLSDVARQKQVQFDGKKFGFWNYRKDFKRKIGVIAAT